MSSWRSNSPLISSLKNFFTKFLGVLCFYFWLGKFLNIISSIFSCWDDYRALEKPSSFINEDCPFMTSIFLPIVIKTSHFHFVYKFLYKKKVGRPDFSRKPHSHRSIKKLKTFYLMNCYHDRMNL